MENEKTCGTCKHNKRNPGDVGDFWCNNPESDNYTDFTDYDTSCEEWEGKE